MVTGADPSESGKLGKGVSRSSEKFASMLDNKPYLKPPWLGYISKSMGYILLL
jgi:hypothetical protein